MPDVRLPWGKWDANGHGAYPLLAHMLDSAAVAWVVLAAQPVVVRRVITELLGAGDETVGCLRFAVLAGLHDLGKCEPVFQGQLWSPRHREFAGHVRRLREAGLPVEAMPARRPRVVGYRDKLGGLFRHEVMTAWLLAELSGLPGWARLIVAGHHGRYPWPVPVSGSRDLARFRENASRPGWRELQRELLATVVGAVAGGGGQDWPVGLPRGARAWVPVLTGLVCVADWIASDEAFVGSSPQDLLDDPAAYTKARLGQAERELPAKLGRIAHPRGRFEDLFPGRYPTRAGQAWAVAEPHGPGLTVVMLPMGEGKTEMALWMHAAGASWGDGLLFGLPTTATADAMFERVREFYGDTETVGHLAHGRAILNAYYRESPVVPLGVCGDDDQGEPCGAGLRPEDWFTGRHRGLLAPVTVGTCDQVLASAVHHKYVQVRLAALATKHVVLDEVHTYDPYQHELLKRLLGWLGAYRIRVTLLSATLATQRLRDYVTAWWAGWHHHDGNLAFDQRFQVEKAKVDGSYPAVVQVSDTVTVTGLAAHRRYQHRVVCHTLSGGPTAFLNATMDVLRRLRDREPHARLGVILNTVDRAIAVARELIGAGHRVLVLHSRMTATQRAEMTAQVHEAVGKEAPAGPVTVVATQIAEASLDLDFDALVTDLAPMASLLQRAGRQWRHSTPLSGGGWTHPEHLTCRTGDPVLHVLVATVEDGLDRGGIAPYSQAELWRTWTARECLDRGRRNYFTMPDDLQAAVDAAQVTLAMLADSDVAEFVRAVSDYVGERTVKSQAAKMAGNDVKGFFGMWFAGDEPGESFSQLTSGMLWRDEALTRLRDAFQITLLPYDPGGQNTLAWAGNPHELPGSLPRERLLDLLGHSIPVTGRLARDLESRVDPQRREAWREQAPALLRDLLPIPITEIEDVVVLDPILGLTRTTEESS